ncbi:outer membrane lipid asymmetry maintenance protein MlaD [Acidihalobacter ferrooxydans]|uniref:Outer membrane lipid asymmetry maintenance protein MlaD n=1 Tax=Acidihalobacter ferrooxydans TaxID=1765967 RepID=A0A1P8UF56_9GAMM|nr:outer membrane lipid asymmetry maintenance protein MlaD [Acidihalobacter ferrooxydans]APZ42456.1 outer membrane lipid asymmetry maintenance protein MlaD [Acidihalobacter ferrooxydans]
MKSSRAVEIMVGLFVAASVAALLVLALKVSNINSFTSDNGYSVYAYFNDIGGLKVGAPVTAAGVTVGRVTGIGYDSKNFEARVTMEIKPQFHDFPVDSSANIYTAGLLGEQYISISPGSSMKNLKNGDRIQYTQSAIVLEKIIGQLMVKLTSK